ncbi:MAG: glycine zipper 2TM domain-containing protein [Betaproteobacteria bacterium]
MNLLEPIRRGARAVVLAVVLAGVAAGCAQQPAYQVYSQPVARSGTVESIRQVDKQKYGTGAGAVVGGLVGLGIGSLIGGGSGRTAAMIVGAGGGALVGNELQKNQTELIWEIGVRYDDGSYGTITQTQSPGLRIGDRVRVTDTGLELLPRGR